MSERESVCVYNSSPSFTSCPSCVVDILGRSSHKDLGSKDSGRQGRRALQSRPLPKDALLLAGKTRILLLSDLRGMYAQGVVELMCFQ